MINSKRWNVALAACAVFVAWDCSAKLGETEGEIQRRYGAPTKRTIFSGAPGGIYTFGDLTVDVAFLDGKSAVEWIIPNDERKFADDEAEALIHAVSGTQDWVKDSTNRVAETKWISKSGFHASTTGSARTEYLKISSAAWDDFAEARRKQKITDLAARFSDPLTTNATPSEVEAALAQEAAALASAATNRPAAAPPPSAADLRRAQSEKAAFTFHLEKAELGNESSQLRLAQLYLKGKGCERDTNQAKIWLEKSAAQGNEEAKRELENFK